MFLIESGSIYLPEDEDKRKSALDCIGVKLGEETRRDLVSAFRAYHGIERDTFNGETWVRIGKPCPYTTPDNWTIEPDFAFHGNVSLRGVLAENHLDCETRQVKRFMGVK